MNTRHPLATWRKTQPEPLTQAQLAALLDVEVGTIKNLESGRRGPSLALLHRIETVTDGAVGSSAFLASEPQPTIPAPMEAESAA